MRAADERAGVGVLIGVLLSIVGAPAIGAVVAALAALSLPGTVYAADLRRQDIEAHLRLRWRVSPSWLVAAGVTLVMLQLILERQPVGSFIPRVFPIFTGLAGVSWATLVVVQRPRVRHADRLSATTHVRVVVVALCGACLVGVGTYLSAST